jgi:hypothetical protein
VPGARVKDWREEKRVVGVGVDLVDGTWGDGCDDGGIGRRAGEQVRGAGARGRGFVAVLGDHEERGGEDGGGGRDVEGVVGVAACADYVALRGKLVYEFKDFNMQTVSLNNKSDNSD